MDLIFNGGRFMVPMGLNRGVKYAWAKDGSIAAESNKPTAIMVQTWPGDFLEVVNAKTKVVIQEGGDGGWFTVNVSRAQVLIRQKKLPAPKLSAAQREKQRKTVTRCLVSDGPHSLGVPDTVAGVIKWLGEQLEKIPETSRAKAEIDFSERREYGESYSNIAITYREKETDEELDLRLQGDAERARLAEIAEREKLKALEAKYAKKRPA